MVARSGATSSSILQTPRPNAPSAPRRTLRGQQPAPAGPRGPTRGSCPLLRDANLLRNIASGGPGPTKRTSPPLLTLVLPNSSTPSPPQNVADHFGISRHGSSPSSALSRRFRASGLRRLRPLTVTHKWLRPAPRQTHVSQPVSALPQCPRQQSGEPVPQKCAETVPSATDCCVPSATHRRPSSTDGRRFTQTTRRLTAAGRPLSIDPRALRASGQHLARRHPPVHRQTMCAGRRGRCIPSKEGPGAGAARI